MQNSQCINLGLHTKSVKCAIAKREKRVHHRSEATPGGLSSISSPSPACSPFQNCRGVLGSRCPSYNLIRPLGIEDAELNRQSHFCCDACHCNILAKRYQCIFMYVTNQQSNTAAPGIPNLEVNIYSKKNLLQPQFTFIFSVPAL